MFDTFEFKDIKFHGEEIYLWNKQHFPKEITELILQYCQRSYNEPAIQIVFQDPLYYNNSSTSQKRHTRWCIDTETRYAYTLEAIHPKKENSLFRICRYNIDTGRRKVYKTWKFKDVQIIRKLNQNLFLVLDNVSRINILNMKTMKRTINTKIPCHYPHDHPFPSPNGDFLLVLYAEKYQDVNLEMQLLDTSNIQNSTPIRVVPFQLREDDPSFDGRGSNFKWCSNDMFYWQQYRSESAPKNYYQILHDNVVCLSSPPQGEKEKVMTSSATKTKVDRVQLEYEGETLRIDEDFILDLAHHSLKLIRIPQIINIQDGAFLRTGVLETGYSYCHLTFKSDFELAYMYGQAKAKYALRHDKKQCNVM
jgi:hypothetical protein